MDSPQISSRSNSSSPIKILKSDSTFAKSFGSKEQNKERKLQFADEVPGGVIAENVYVEQLHYSNHSYQVAPVNKGCYCIIS